MDSNIDSEAKKQMEFAKRYTGVKGCEEVYKMANRIAEGHPTRENLNSPEIRTVNLPSSPPIHSIPAPTKAPTPSVPSK